MPAIVRIDSQVEWFAFRDRVTSHWIAECLPLNLVAEGETWPELEEMVAEITNDMLATLFREGTLAQFLRDHGWTPVTAPPKVAPDEEILIDMPRRIVAVPAHVATP
jgi:hypothetical protein